MLEREKVMLGLEICSTSLVSFDDCLRCPYDKYIFCQEQLCEDALALLKEQEARVMTLEEVIASEEWMWTEYISGYCGWQRQNDVFETNGSILWNDETADEECEYGKRWRCWDKRPTEEQRKAVPWNE